MRFEVNCKVYDDDGELLGDNSLSVEMPEGPTLEAKHVVLGEGQVNLSKLAEQCAMHAIWLGARKVVDKIDEQTEKDLAMPEIQESVGKTPMDMPDPDATQ